MARNILIHEDGTAKVGLLIGYKTSKYENKYLGHSWLQLFQSPFILYDCVLSVISQLTWSYTVISDEEIAWLPQQLFILW